MHGDLLVKRLEGNERAVTSSSLAAIASYIDSVSDDSSPSAGFV